MRKVLATAVLAAMLGTSFIAPSFAADNSNSTEEVRIEKVEFDTRVVEDRNLPESVQVVIQEGKEGKRTFFKSFREMPNTSGALEDIPVYHDEITELPVEKVIRKGVNKSVINGVSSKTIKLEKTKAVQKTLKEAAEKKRKKEELDTKISREVANAGSSSFNSSNLSKIGESGEVTTIAENKAYAKSVMSASDYAIANQLINRESGWKTTVANSSSGAYGIPQSLPGNKMSSEGSDWRTNGATQIDWMIKYVKQRYGSWGNALAHSHAKGWY